MIQARKSLGQNFLVDTNISRRIVAAAGLTRDDVVIEIGPGQGALTGILLEFAGRLIAIEIDPRCADLLRQRFTTTEESPSGKPRFHLVLEDILKVDLNRLLNDLGSPSEQRVSVVANLPYYLSTPVLEHLLQYRARIRNMVLMLQREVVERIVSPPGNKDYGSLSVFIQYYCQVEKLFNVSPGAFRPQPKVTSSLLRLTMRQQAPVAVRDEALFFRLVRTAFSQRRKTLTNNLKALAGSAERANNMITEAGLDPQRRAETLSLAEFASLANYFAIQRSEPML